MSQSPWIFLGKVVGVHGIPKDGKRTFKILFFNPGSQAVKQKIELLGSTDQGKTAFPLKPIEISPWGAKWGQSKGALISFLQADCPEIGIWVGVLRAHLPELAEKEFYVCDLMEADVFDSETDAKLGKIFSFYDPTENLGPQRSTGLSSVVFQVKTDPLHFKSLGPEFDFPSPWINRFDLKTNSVWIEGFEAIKLNFLDKSPPDRDS